MSFPSPNYRLTADIKASTQQNNLNILQSIKQLSCSVLQKDIQVFQKQSQKLTQSINTMLKIQQKISFFKNQCLKLSKDIEHQIYLLQKQIEEYHSQAHVTKSETIESMIRTKNQEYMHEWEARIQLANNIKIEKFSKVSIEDRKSKANEIFKLILLVFYSEPIAKYYWPNFKREAFVNDGGEDLKQRLGRIKPTLLKEEQKAQIKYFLSIFNQIYFSKELSKVTEEVDTIKSIVQLFLKCYELSLSIKELKNSIELQKQKKHQGEEEVQKWTFRAEALAGRKNIVDSYIGALELIANRLENKRNQYNHHIETLELNVERLNNAKSSVQSNDKIDVDFCECRVM